MPDIETVKVKHTNENGDDHMIINKSDFDPDKHELYDEADAGSPISDEEREIARKKEIERRAEANRGVPGSNSLYADGKNPSGTFSEPTPTDIRYPDKNATEFENNHGAFVGKSAAEMRDALGMADQPGGLRPEVHAAVQGSELAATAAADLAATPASEPGEVAIADDWADLHHMTQIKLAKQISGNDDVSSAEDARAIIQAEVDKRAADKAEADKDAADAAKTETADPAVV